MLNQQIEEKLCLYEWGRWRRYDLNKFHGYGEQPAARMALISQLAKMNDEAPSSDSKSQYWPDQARLEQTDQLVLLLSRQDHQGGIAIKLKYVAGLSERQIAARLHCSRNAACAHIAGALNFMYGVYQARQGLEKDECPYVSREVEGYDETDLRLIEELERLLA